MGSNPTPSAIQSPLFATNPTNLPTSIDFVDINGSLGYIARNTTNQYGWAVLVFTKGNLAIEIDTYTPMTNDLLVQIAKSIQ